MPRLIATVLTRLGLPADALVTRSLGSILVNVSAQGANFVLAIVLARALGVEGFGVYSFALAWALVLGVPAGLGLNRLLMREMAALREKNHWGQALGLIRWARWASLIAATVVAILTALLFYTLMPAGLQRTVLLLALLLLPLNALLRVHQGVTVGLGHVIAGQVPGAVVQPILFLGLALALWWTGKLYGPDTAMSLNIGATAVALLTAATLAWYSLPGEIRNTLPARAHPGPVLMSALTLTLLGGLNLLNARLDAIMLGLLTDVRNVGLYTAAARGAELVSFFIGPVYAVIAPELSRLHAVNARDALQTMATRATRLALVLALPVAVILALFGALFLSLFGPAFVDATGALRVLVGGHLVFVTMGPALLLLIMTRAERVALACAVTGTVINIVGNLLLIPRYGALGAAMATTLSLLVWNVLAVRACIKQLGINPTAFARST